MEFTQYSCPVCGKRFVNGDDVVVCPECGAPHHRECYEENGDCFYRDRHAEGFSFENESANSENTEGENVQTVTCPGCGAENEKTDFYCGNCGYPLDARDRQQNTQQNPNQNQMPFGGNGGFPMFDPLAGLNGEDEIADGVKVSEAAKFIGKNTPYYLFVFNRLKTTGSGKFNLSAFIFSGAFFLYRKMYALGIILTLLMIGLTVGSAYLLVTPPWSNTYREIQEVASSMSIFSSSTADSASLLSGDKMLMAFVLSTLMLAPWAVMTVCGFTANRIYYKHCTKQVKKLKQNTAGSELNKALEENGGVNLAVGIAAFATLMIIRELCSLLPML